MGEKISCTVLWKREYTRKYASRRNTPWEHWQPTYDGVFTFPFCPTTPGIQQIGPVSITLGNETVTADAVPLVILPDMGTNDFFEVRICQSEIKRAEKIEVVVQSRQFQRIPNPYYKASRNEKRPHYLTTLRETDDWRIRTCYRQGLSGPSGDDERGRYILNGRLEVYNFEPKRIGQLKITKDLFRNLPDNYTFEERTITVKD